MTIRAGEVECRQLIQWVYFCVRPSSDLVFGSIHPQGRPAPASSSCTTPLLLETRSRSSIRVWAYQPRRMRVTIVSTVNFLLPAFK